MASQQAQFADTIRSMKAALKRRADDTEDPPLNSTTSTTNRANKHRRGGEHLLPNRLNTTAPRSSYRRSRNHAGYTRPTISTNPLLYDLDGDVVSPTDSDAEERGLGESIEDNPFGEVRLEQLLRPLTSAAELADHPSLSLPYKSRALTLMADEALEMLRREREVLWRAKRLLRRFRGDGEWVPSEEFETEMDEAMLMGGREGESAVPSVAFETGSVDDLVGDQAVEMDGDLGDKMEVEDNSNGNGVGEMAVGVEAMDMAVQQAALEASSHSAAEVEATTLNPELDHPAPAPPNETEPSPHPPQIPSLDPNAAPDDSDPNSTPTTNTHAMTTRARARSPAAGSGRGSPTPSSSTSIPSIHPWFLHPASAIPDRDLGLPATEAEETRRMLLLYVQKQDHLVRQLQLLSEGLLKADRLRTEVYRWCKAEGHTKVGAKGERVTEMSDGEDWYDPADWGLGERELKVLKDGTVGLEKGRDEVEEGFGEDEGMGRRVIGRRGRRAVASRI